MPKRWGRLPYAGLVLLMLICTLLSGGTGSAAAPNVDEKRRLLEKGLTVYELDREIRLLEEEERMLIARLEKTNRQAEDAARQVLEQEERTKQLIRSYYAGDRTSIWLAAWNTRSLKDTLYVWEQLQIILNRDKLWLDEYAGKYRSFKEAQAQLAAERSRLADTKRLFAEEKQRRLLAQQEVEKLLAENADAIRIKKEMDQLASTWEEQGLPLFKRYFAALADVMPKLPEMFGQNSRMLTIKGLSSTVEIGDTQLNRFLQDKSKDLTGFSFVFDKDGIYAGGKAEGISIALTGRYTVDTSPVNAVRFRVDTVAFNGYEMPSATVKSLERQFDLAFYPGKLSPFIQATAVKMDKGKMTVHLKLSL